MSCPDPEKRIQELEQRERELSSRYQLIRSRYLAALEDFQTWRDRAMQLEEKLKTIQEVAAK